MYLSRFPSMDLQEVSEERMGRIWAGELVERGKLGSDDEDVVDVCSANQRHSRRSAGRKASGRPGHRRVEHGILEERHKGKSEDRHRGKSTSPGAQSVMEEMVRNARGEQVQYGTGECEG